MKLSHDELQYILVGLESIEIFPDKETKEEVQKLIFKVEDEINNIYEKEK